MTSDEEIMGYWNLISLLAIDICNIEDSDLTDTGRKLIEEAYIMKIRSLLKRI